MSNNVNITLSSAQYNGLHGAAGTFCGKYSKIVGSRLVEQIGEAVRAEVRDGAMPESITISIPSSNIDGIYLGLVELSEQEKVNSADIRVLGELAKSIKCARRWDKHLESIIATIPESEDPIDSEELETPIDD